MLDLEFKNGYTSYFLGNKAKIINSVEKIKEDNLEINLIDNNIKLIDNKIFFKISSLYSKNDLKKEIVCDYYIDIPKRGNYDLKLIKNVNWIRRK